ncbi:MAG: hypothetical protein AAB448_01485 [Patescibacteria group bacterium]
MDVERLKVGEKGPETYESDNGAETATVAGVDRQQSEQDVAAAVAERKSAVEHAARSRREMKDPLLVRIESLLADGLADEYATLSPDKKQAFKQEGEALAVWLHSALANGTAKPHEVLMRLEGWLLIIEGKDRSSPWLLQEAYVRARRALEYMMYTEKGH